MVFKYAQKADKTGNDSHSESINDATSADDEDVGVMNDISFV